MHSIRSSVRRVVLALSAVPVLALADGVPGADMTARPHPLAGTWQLEAAEALTPDGRRVPDYGAAPKGRLIVDAQGRYSLQIFKSERPRFASADKSAASAAEYQAAAMGSSTHYGRIEVAADGATITFGIEGSSFPNWEGTRQTRAYELTAERLSYRVPPRPDGTVPISVWRRVP